MIVPQDPNPIAELAAGTLGLVLTIFVHGIGVRWITRVSSGYWARFTPQTSAWRVNMVFACVIAALVALHLFETLAAALTLYRLALVPSLRDAYYFVLGSYTTVGSGETGISTEWRLIGPIVAMAGLFTFGWTASTLVATMTDIARLDRAQARRDARDEADPS